MVGSDRRARRRMQSRTALRTPRMLFIGAVAVVSRSEVVATKIDNIVCGGLRLLPDLRNFSSLRYDLQAFTNSVRENKARVCENHAVNVQPPMPNVQRPIFMVLPERIAFRTRSVHFPSCDEFRIRRRNH